MKKATLSFALFTLLTGLAFGQSRVLVYTGNDSFLIAEPQAFNRLGSQLALSGLTTDVTTAFPSDLSNYRCVFLPINQENFTDAQKEALFFFVYGGGNVIAAGEWAVVPRTNPVMNDLASYMGVDMSITTDQFDCGCRTTAQVNSHYTTTFVNSVRFACVSRLNVGPSATRLLSSEPSQVPFIGVQQLGFGYFFLTSECSVFVDPCFEGTLDNHILIHNVCTLYPPLEG